MTWYAQSRDGNDWQDHRREKPSCFIPLSLTTETSGTYNYNTQYSASAIHIQWRRTSHEIYSTQTYLRRTKPSQLKQQMVNWSKIRKQRKKKKNQIITSEHASIVKDDSGARAKTTHSVILRHSSHSAGNLTCDGNISYPLSHSQQDYVCILPIITFHFTKRRQHSDEKCCPTLQTTLDLLTNNVNGTELYQPVVCVQISAIFTNKSFLQHGPLIDLR